MNHLFSKLYANYSEVLSQGEKETFKLLVKHCEVIPTSTINEMANSAYISSSSLYRLVKKLGFQGYSDFKYQVSSSLKTESILNNSTEEYLTDTINEIKYTHKINQQNLIKAANLILQKKERYVYGTGWKQKQLIDNFASDMMLYGLNFFGIRNLDDLNAAVSNMSEDAIIVFVSLNGNALDYKEALDMVELNNVHIISITLDTANQLSMKSEIALYYADQHVSSNLSAHWRSISLLYILNLLVQATITEKEKGII